MRKEPKEFKSSAEFQLAYFEDFFCPAQSKFKLDDKASANKQSPKNNQGIREALRADIEAFNKERSGSSDNLRPNGASSSSNKHQSAIMLPSAFNQQSPKHTLTDARPLEELLEKGEGRQFNSLMATKHRSAVVGNDVFVSSFL